MARLVVAVCSYPSLMCHAIVQVRSASWSAPREGISQDWNSGGKIADTKGDSLDKCKEKCFLDETCKRISYYPPEKWCFQLNARSADVNGNGVLSGWQSYDKEGQVLAATTTTTTTTTVEL